MGDMSREPSMEDILSSIRRVIARDEAPGAAREITPAVAEDILDLHDEEDDGAEAAPAADELVSEASADAARRNGLADGYDRGFDMPAVVAWLRSQLKVPVLTGLPFGHVPTKVLLPVGHKVRLMTEGRDALIYWG